MRSKYPQFKYTWDQWHAIYGDIEMGTACLDTMNDRVAYFHNDTGSRDLVWCGEVPKQAQGWSFDKDDLLFADPEDSFNFKRDNGFASPEYITDLEAEFEHEANIARDHTDYDTWSGYVTEGKLNETGNDFIKKAVTQLSKEYGIIYPELAYAAHSSDNGYWIVIDGQQADEEFPGETDSVNVAFKVVPDGSGNPKVSMTSTFDGDFASDHITKSWINSQEEDVRQIVLEEYDTDDLHDIDLHLTPKALNGRPLYQEYDYKKIFWNGDYLVDIIQSYGDAFYYRAADKWGDYKHTWVHLGYAPVSQLFYAGFQTNDEAQHMVFEFEITPNGTITNITDKHGYGPFYSDPMEELQANNQTYVPLYDIQKQRDLYETHAATMMPLNPATTPPLTTIKRLYAGLATQRNIVNPVLKTVCIGFGVEYYYIVAVSGTQSRRGYLSLPEETTAVFILDSDFQLKFSPSIFLGDYHKDAHAWVMKNHPGARCVFDSRRTLSENANSTYELDGKVFDTVVFTSEDDANEFMADNSGYSILATDGGTIHVSKSSDKGTPVEDDDTPAEDETTNENKMKKSAINENYSLTWDEYVYKHGDPEPGTPCYDSMSREVVYFDHQSMGSNKVWCTADPDSERGWYLSKHRLSFKDQEYGGYGNDDYEMWERKNRNKSPRTKAMMERKLKSKKSLPIKESTDGPVSLPVSTKLMPDDFKRAFDKNNLFFKGINVREWFLSNMQALLADAENALNGGDGQIVYFGYDPESEMFYVGVDGFHDFDGGDGEMRGVTLPLWIPAAITKGYLPSPVTKTPYTSNYDGTFYPISYDALKRDYSGIIDLVLD